VTLCKNDRCGAVTMSGQLPSIVGTSVSGTRSGDLSIDAYLWNDEPYRMTIDFSMYDDDDFREGDAYTLLIVDMDGAVILENTWTGDYRESFPNGERCGPRCLDQRVELTAP
jgi:hypothetical protein